MLKVGDALVKAPALQAVADGLSSLSSRSILAMIAHLSALSWERRW